MSEQDIPKASQKADSSRGLWVGLSLAVFGILTSAIATVAPEIIKGTMSRYSAWVLLITVVGAVTALGIATALARRFAFEQPRGGSRLEMEIRSAYLSALEKSPLNPNREGEAHNAA
ncbi:MAG TPA: hypothetical protein VGM86_32375 [Thermoanaerobaculia bacterium]|jgi:hypothetical protein